MLAINGGTPIIGPGDISPWPHITNEDRTAVLAVMDRASPWRWPFEPIQEFEQAWAQAIGLPYTIAVNSGTAALHMAVAAAGVEPGDEVIVPADTFLATASCVLQANAIPVFADTLPHSYNIDPEQVEQRITARTKAIIAVDLNGLPADYDELGVIARKHGIALIEDAAQSHGAVYKNRPAGALADMSGASLNGSKALSALGEGGLFATADEQQYLLARKVMMFGEEITGKTRDYNARIMGWNYRIDLMAAAFAHSQLGRLPEMSRIRSENGAALTEALAGVPGLATPAVPPDRTHVYFFYPVLVHPEELGLDGLSIAAFRDAVIEACLAEGLPISRWQHHPVPAQPLFQERRGYGRGCPWTCGHATPQQTYRPEDFPVAEDICLRRLVLGQSLSPFGPPNGLATMKRYAEVLTKVLVEGREELVRLALALREQ